jgi:hypothetical protein
MFWPSVVMFTFELAKHLHTAFMLGVPTHRSIFSISVVVTPISSNFSEKLIFFEKADNSATLPWTTRYDVHFNSTQQFNYLACTVNAWKSCSVCALGMLCTTKISKNTKMVQKYKKQ